MLVAVAIGAALSFALVVRLIASDRHRIGWARCRASLSESEQADLAEQTRRMIPEQIGLPASVPIRRIASSPLRAGKCEWGDGDDDGPQRVYAMTTRIELAEPHLQTVKAWFATHPDNPYGPGLDAAWDTDLYRPSWDVFEQMSRKLRTMGFDVQHDSPAQPGLPQSRSLSLQGDGVAIDFHIEGVLPIITLTRHW